MRGLNGTRATPSHIINYNLLHSRIQERTVKRLAMMFFALLLMVSLVSAQEATPEVTPILVPPGQVDVPPEELPPVEPGETTSPLGIEAAEALPVLVAARGDLEILASEVMASPDQRPAGWSGSLDVADPNLPLFIRLDLEILAGTVLGPELRPDGWFGVVASSPLAIARDIRHDLELLADHVVGASTLRPGMWVGDDPLMRCNRATQALVPLLERSGFTLNVDFAQPDYCQQIEIQVSRYVETQIVQPPAAAGGVGTGTVAVAGIAQPYITESPFVVAFYDTNARRRAGVLPVGTGFRPISRSDFEFSNMMLIEGEGFTLFVDYTTTPLSLADFEALPVSSLGTTTDCDMAWCGQ
jgi:hypothetical protein